MSCSKAGLGAQQWNVSDGRDALIQLRSLFHGTFQACSQCYKQFIGSCTGPSETNPQVDAVHTTPKVGSHVSAATLQWPFSNRLDQPGLINAAKFAPKRIAASSSSNLEKQKGVVHKRGQWLSRIKPEIPDKSKRLSPTSEKKISDPKQKSDASATNLGDHPVLNNNLPCCQTLKDLSNNSYDTAAALLFLNTTINLRCGIGNNKRSDIPITCTSFNDPGGYVVLQSILTLSNTVNNMYNAIEAAQSYASGNMVQFARDFYPPQSSPSLDVPIMLGLLSTVLGLFGGITEIEAAPFVAAIGTGVLGIAGTVYSGSQPQTPAPDPGSIMSNITSIAQTVLAKWSQELFRTGQVQYHQPNDQGRTFLDLYEIIGGGGAITDPDVNLVIDVVPTYEKAIYMRTALVAWNSSGLLQPFIVYDDGACSPSKAPAITEITKHYLGAMQKIPDWNSVSLTVDNQCYYLLAASQAIATDQGRGQTFDFDYCLLTTAPGGTRNILTGVGNGPYSGLEVDDVISSAVSGWKAHGMQNGCSSPIKPGTTSLPTSVRDTGIVTTLPVCSYANGDLSGLNCPSLKDKHCASSQLVSATTALKGGMPTIPGVPVQLSGSKSDRKSSTGKSSSKTKPPEQKALHG